MSERPHSIYQQGIFRLLREGNGVTSADKFFYETLTPELKKAAAQYGCETDVATQRMLQARSYWDSDLTSLSADAKIRGDRPIPCHIKHSAFLCYWLRRRVVVDYVRDVSPIENSAFQQELVGVYGAEFLVFDVCYRLCLYGELVDEAANERDLVRQIERHNLPLPFRREVAVFLHHKNVSPHALYLMFKTLMLNAPRFSAKAVTLVQ